MRHLKTLSATLMASALVLSGGQAALGGEIHINMYSLPVNGVQLRNDIAIRVRAFKTQISTDTTPLLRGNQELAIRPRGADANGNVSTGTAVFDVPDALFAEARLENLPISFQFQIGNTVVQTVLAAVVPRNGRVDLHVVVPDPTRIVCSSPVFCCDGYYVSGQPLLGKAMLEVTLPEKAKLFIDDGLTNSKGSLRRFESPLLKIGQEYSYTLKSDLEINGKAMTVTQAVIVRGGETTRVIFDLPTTSISATQAK